MLRRFILGAVASTASLVATLASAATLTLSAPAGPPTSTTIVTGAGFTANTIVDVYFDLTQQAFQATTASGGFSLTLTAPASAAPGLHTITVMPHFGAGASAQANFRIITSAFNWHGDATGRGWNQTENTLNYSTISNLSESTRFTAGGGVYGAPIAVAGYLYYITSDLHLRAINRLNGAQIFDVATSANYIVSPASGGGLVYVAGNGKLYARRTLDGALVWQANLPPGVGAPIFYGGNVYVVAQGAADAGLFVFRATCGTGGATCTPLWRGPGGSTGSYWFPEGSVAINGSHVFAKMGTTLYQFTLGCGSASCAPYSTRADVQSWSPVASNGYVYVVDRDLTSGIYYLTALKSTCVCSVAWRSQLSFGSSRSVAVASNRVFVADGTIFRAYPAACGDTVCAPLWSTSLPSVLGYSPVVAGDFVYLATTRDIIAFPTNCYNGCTGVWHGGSGGLYSNVPYASVTVLDGVVYAPDDAGLQTYALRTPAKSPAKVEISTLRPSPALASAEAQYARQFAAR